MQYEKQIAAWVVALNKLDRSFYLVFNEGTPTPTHKFADEDHGVLTRRRKRLDEYAKYHFKYNFWPLSGGYVTLEGDEVDIAIGLVENDDMRTKIHSIFPYMNDDNTIEDMAANLVRDISEMIDVRKNKQAQTREEKGADNLEEMIASYSNIPTNDKGQAIPGDFYPDEVDDYMTSTAFISRSGVDVTPSFLGTNASQLSKYLNVPIQKNEYGDFPVNEYRTDVLLGASCVKTKMQKLNEEYQLN